MTPPALPPRRKDLSTAWFVAYVLGCVVLFSLPGFLLCRFWEGWGLGISVLVGALSWPLSYLVLSYALLPVLWLVLRCTGRAPGRSAKGKWRSGDGDASGGGGR